MAARPTLAPFALSSILAAGVGFPAVVGFTGCGAATPSPVDGAAGPDLGPASPLVAARPYDFQEPNGLDPKQPAPLVVLLHGYSANAFVQDAYFGFGAFALTHGILYAMPNGTFDSKKNRFWNATDACCDLDGTNVDDVAYLTAVLDDVQAHYNVDPKRIYFIGHSNGGFMSHRMACDRASRVAAIMALAGDNWKDVSKCKPSTPVAVLQVHGDMDTEVPYGGAAPALPSAEESIRSWVTLDGCAPAADASAKPLDLDSVQHGAETTIERWSGCKPGGAAELWTMHGSGHLPNFWYPGMVPPGSPSWPEAIWGFLSTHPKP